MPRSATKACHQVMPSHPAMTGTKISAKSHCTFRSSWIKSGDKYTCEPDGYYTYAGRNDIVPKVSGMKVSRF